jgi:hypothetical protein
MARLFDRIKDTATTTGTGDFTISGTPPTGYLTFSSVYTVGDEQVPYCIAQQASAEWEVGLGTYSASNTLRRDWVKANSAGTFTQISFSAGTKDVFVTISADVGDITGRQTAITRGMAMP